MSIREKIRTIPDFPIAGIQFRDITTLLSDTDGFQETIQTFYDRYKSHSIDYIAGIEARGFILGGALALKLNKGFIPVRKKGKLPGKTLSHTYDLEYGSDTLEIHEDAFEKGAKILIIDDLLATGGTAIAAATLVSKAGGIVDEIAFVIDLPDVGGRALLNQSPYSFFALCEFEGD